MSWGSHFITASMKAESIELFSDYMKSFENLPILSREEEKELGLKKYWKSDRVYLKEYPIPSCTLQRYFGRPPTPKELAAVLPTEEGDVVLKKDQEADKAFNTLVKHNLKLVVSIAKKHLSKGLPLLDLIQEGNIGLLRAIEKFDPHKDYKFSTYAVWWIKQAVTRGLYDKGRLIRLPVHMGESVYKIKKLMEQEEQRTGQTPSYEFIGKALDLTPEKVKSILKMADQVLSLNDINSTSDKELIEDLECLQHSYFADDIVSQICSMELLPKVKMLVTEKEFHFLTLRFGLQGKPSMAYSEIGELMGMNKERVRQIVNSAISKLRTELTHLQEIV